MDQSKSDSQVPTKFSLARLVATIIGIFLISAIAYWYGVNSVELAIPNEGRALKSFGLDTHVKNRLDERFTDKNEDRVADPPVDPDDWIDPETLLFSYGSTQQAYHHTEQVWSDLLEYLADQTGKPVQFVSIETPQEQISALANRALHIAGTNPGSVPLLVNTCGFVPVCTASKDGRLQTYRMQLIVPASSTASEPNDLRGRMLTLTDPSSNSGWKAPLVILMNDFGLQPMRDYLTNYSGSHIASIKGIAAGEYEAAAVADTEVTLAIKRGDIEENQVKVIYYSKPFPYDCLGYVHNLQPELAEKIRDALLSFDWTGTSLLAEFESLGFRQFVKLSYGNDFATVREIDDAMGHKHSLKPAFHVVPGR
jgi:phosphonate transport system substrate-binding protein